MGHESEDTFTALMQDILSIAHGLKEATAVSNSASRSSTRTSDSPVVIDSINLPTPPPILPLLLEAGISHEIASAASQIYQQRAEQLKQHIQESIIVACRTAAEFPAHTSALPLDLFVKRVTSIFTDVYFDRLMEWKEEMIQRIKRASETPMKAASRNSRTFNQEYVPLLEHFFNENPFPTHADKIFLAQKSNMQYRQIHVWFQNRRNRTKREVKPLRKKPIYEGPTQPLDKLYEHMKGYTVNSQSQVPEFPQAEGSAELEVTRNDMPKDAFASSSPLHAFPSPYPPTCRYDPFPCKRGPVSLSKPQWRRVPDGKRPLLLSTSIDDLIEKFSHLNVRDKTRSKGSPKLQSRAATAAITVIPSRAPHPSLIVCKHRQPTIVVQHHPSVRAPVSHSKGFQSPSPTSKPVTLVPLSVSPNKSELSGRRKTAPLPRRFPGWMRNTRRDSTPSESSMSSPPSRSSSLTHSTSVTTEAYAWLLESSKASDVDSQNQELVAQNCYPSPDHSPSSSPIPALDDSLTGESEDDDEILPPGPRLHAVSDPLPLSTLESEVSIDEWLKTNPPPPVDVVEPDLLTQCEVELFNNYVIPENPQKALTSPIQDNYIVIY